MNADLGTPDRSRIHDPYPSRSTLWSVLGLVALVVGIGAFASVFVASSLGYKFKALMPAAPPGQDFSALYARYGVGAIPAGEIDDDMEARLRKLAAEPCDWTAMSKLGKALETADENRLAADFDLGFSRQCSQNAYAEREAAGLFYKLSDFKLALRYYGDLAARFPQNDLDWYHKGQAEAKLGLNEDALQSYATMMSLTLSKERLGDWVFYEMAEIYAAQGRFCEAMTPIDTYISLDPHARDVSKTREVLARYAERGHCNRYASGNASFPVLDNNVVTVRAAINGTVGTFAIDTGASFVALTPAFASKAKIAASGAMRSSTANGDVDVQLSKASTVTLGGLKATDVPLVVVTKPMGRLDGLLGRSLLARYEMTMGRHRLTLTSKQP